MEYSRSAIRELVTKALTLDELNDLVFDYFPDVDEEFAEGQTKSQRIKILLRYAEKHRKKNYLLDKIKKINPPVFQEFKSSVWERGNFSDLASQEEQAINKLIEYLENKSFDKLEYIYLSCSPKKASQTVTNIDHLLEELNRFVYKQKYRPIIPFVVKVKQDFPDLERQLESWLGVYGNFFGYAEFNRTQQQTSNQPSPSSKNDNPPESYLLIELKKINSSCLQIQGWFWSDDLCRNIQEQDKIEIDSTESEFQKKYYQLSKKITELIQKSNTIMVEIGSKDLRIELFLEINLITENDFCVDWLNIKKGNFDTVMCRQYTVNFRLAERLRDESQDLKGAWGRKWKKLNSNNGIVVDYCYNIDCQLERDETVGIKLDRASKQAEFFEKIYLKALPIALWSRRDLQTISCSRLQDAQLKIPPNIGKYVQLGAVGTAFLPNEYPRVLLIDEIDKSDIDLPNDLLNLFEEGVFEIPELARIADQEKIVEVRTYDNQKVEISQGQVACTQFPLVIMTSNGERDFPPAFLRRCLRLEMPEPDVEQLTQIVQSHFNLEQGTLERAIDLIKTFVKERKRGQNLATDQLLNVIFMLTREKPPSEEDKEVLLQHLLRSLDGR